jgi:hypothetical protein
MSSTFLPVHVRVVVTLIVPFLRVQVAMLDGAPLASPSPPQVAAIPTANPNAIQRARFAFGVVSMFVPPCRTRHTSDSLEPSVLPTGQQPATDEAPRARVPDGPLERAELLLLTMVEIYALLVTVDTPTRSHGWASVHDRRPGALRS